MEKGQINLMGTRGEVKSDGNWRRGQMNLMVIRGEVKSDGN